jgi:hypothetical protein
MSDKHFGFAVFKNVRDLGRREQRVNGHDDCSERQDCIIHARKIIAVRHEQRNAIARIDAPLTQRCSDIACLQP